MEVEGGDGSTAIVRWGYSREFGRESGFKSNDRTVSRRHVSLHLNSINDPRVSFEVIGKNPIWVHDSTSGEIKVYRRYERGELETGDMFCLSAKNPLWFTLRRIDLDERDKTGFITFTETALENELAESLQSSSVLTETEELELESVDLSNIDPVEEFGFLVIGKEFDGYHKKMVRDIKDWDWFLEESGVETDEEDNEVGEGKGKKIAGTKRRKRKGNNEDDEWVGESDEDKEMIVKSTKAEKPKYLTRSKDRDKTLCSKFCKKPRLDKSTHKNKKENEEDDDEDDETLGGFIVDDEGAEHEVESDGDEDEEEEFEDDEDE